MSQRPRLRVCRLRIDPGAHQLMVRGNWSKQALPQNIRTCRGFVILSIALLLVTGSAAAAAPNDARAGILATIEKTNALQKRNAPAREIAAALFEDDLMITGEGESRGYKSLASFIDTFTRLSAGDANCDLRLIDPIRSSGDLAAAFLSQHCPATKVDAMDEDSRVLFVFRKSAKGWRVTMGHWSGGKF